MDLLHAPTPNACRHYRSAAIAFPRILCLPAPPGTHLRRYLYVCVLLLLIISILLRLSNGMFHFCHDFEGKEIT